MRASRAPRVETRRTADFLRELRERTRAWIPTWDLSQGQGDFGQALLEIAARFNSEVAERLDQTGEKMRGSFLDWLGMRGKAARPARMPVVFKLNDAAQESVPALSPLRLQAEATGVPVVFETETSLNLVPAKLELIAAADPANDAYYLPPPDLSSLNPVDHLPTQWTVKSFAPAGTITLQLTPGLGLAVGSMLQLNAHQYLITAADKDLVTIEPALLGAVDAGTSVAKVEAFLPFDGEAENQQEHTLYLGDSDLLNVDAAASIAILGADSLQAGIRWQYWGKKGSADDVAWQDLIIAPTTDQIVPGALVLTKPEGSIEQKEINGRNSRWIRAYAQTVLPSQRPFTASGLAIQINPNKCAAAPCPQANVEKPPQADAMANTTPLILDNLFFPLGKEPRQFDAFYLGSNEAFSKQGANVQLCFEMADRTFSSLSAVRGVSFGADRVVAGVARDRALHLVSINPDTGTAKPFRQRKSLYPPSPVFLIGPQPGSPVMLDKDPRWRPPVWPESILGFPGFLTAVCAGNSIWVWHEHPFAPSGWVNFGQLPSDSANVDSLVFLTDGGPKLVALRKSQLFIRDWPSGANWNLVTPHSGGTQPVSLTSIVAVRAFTSAGGDFTESGTAEMVGIDTSGSMFRVQSNGLCTPLLAGDQFDSDVLPAAVQLDGNLIVSGVLKAAGQLSLVANHAISGRVVKTTNSYPAAVAALEPVLRNGAFHVLLTASDGAAGTLLDWAPFVSPLDLFASPITIAATDGAPVEIDGLVVVPGERADILSSKYDPAARFSASTPIKPGIVLSDTFPTLAPPDFIVRLDAAGNPVESKIDSAEFTKAGESFYTLTDGFPAGATRLDAFAVTDKLSGKKVSSTDWRLDLNDNLTVVNGLIQNHGCYFLVKQISLLRVATVKPLDGAVLQTGDYIPSRATGGRIAPYMDSVPGTWDAAALARGPMRFPQNDPALQSAKAFSVDASGHPTLVTLGTEFENTVAHPFNYFMPPVPFLVDAAFGDWHRDTGDTSNNPELSWEYWSGKGWSRLNVQDDTINLQITGAVLFTIPQDLAPSDWAGKTNPWIRARLIGGDYGREKVTFDGQTVTRSTDDIHPPTVVRLTISYGLCKAAPPSFVLTSDSGSVLDQSSANRSSGAIVEAFIPLAVTLGRLLSAPTAAEQADVPCPPPPCDCPGQSSTSISVAAPTGVLAARTSTERCLLVGLSGSVSGAPVNLLILIAEEREHGKFAPLTVEALVANQFVPIVASDGTRAIGESGLISMSFAVPPSSAELLGQSLIWLRITPKAGTDTSSWQPTIAGAYINAVFASATETLTRELAGSSEGGPNLTLTLARPPLLANRLELRVREPLGDEERKNLQQQGQVVSDDPDLTGDWVLWKQVDDPADEPAAARVYALDESTGEFRFGDGLHGMIPPIGRDSIVAFRYQRTEPPPPGVDTAPGNAITARTTLNLVSPVETVESVISAGDAAGGAAPEPDALVLQFGYARIRHRDRAVTLRDFEEIALESSPAIVQARAFAGPGGTVRLVAVMRGRDPGPTAAQVRELRRYLLSFAPPALAAPQALTIVGPALRSLRLALSLEVDTLDAAADVSVAVKTRLVALFDPAHWTAGQNPTDDDIAKAIGSVPGLESIGDITLREVDAGGKELPWPTQLKATDLAILAADPVRLQFQSVEVTA